MTNHRAATSWEPINDDECRRATAIVEFVGKRWTSGIMLALGRGATRFTEIETVVEGLSARLLSARLRELEQRHLVERIVAPTTPVSVSYVLTPQGRELLSTLHGLAVWGSRWENHGRAELEAVPKAG